MTRQIEAREAAALSRTRLLEARAAERDAADHRLYGAAVQAGKLANARRRSRCSVCDRSVASGAELDSSARCFDCAP